MGAGLKKNGTRALVAATVVCAALSPAALAAVGGVSAAGRDAAADGTGGAFVPASRDARTLRSSAAGCWRRPSWGR